MSTVRFVTAVVVLVMLMTTGIGFDARVHAAGGPIALDCHTAQAWLDVIDRLPDSALEHFGKMIGLDLQGRDLIDYLQKLVTECQDPEED